VGQFILPVAVALACWVLQALLPVVLVAVAVILAHWRVVYLVLRTQAAAVAVEMRDIINPLRKMVVPVVPELL
jgi:hypothetical protein